MLQNLNAVIERAEASSVSKLVLQKQKPLATSLPRLYPRREWLGFTRKLN
jgi:hypothetical protein